MMVDQHEDGYRMRAIDKDGFRPNVGIVLTNRDRHVFWGKRIGYDHWQFPQGGISSQEPLEEALFRELKEETGLEPEDVTVLAQTPKWLRYRLPKHLIRHYRKPICIGQKQKWFLLQLNAPDEKIRLDVSSRPEFDSWRWVDYWYPMKEVIAFKHHVYLHMLKEFEPLLFPSPPAAAGDSIDASS